ncbi:MAG: hypothetical protein HY901_28120, partial [Deltaproteobacteria bacterium]|nr:hypothetical protein [Deltaproteobacteria bacterium]
MTSRGGGRGGARHGQPGLLGVWKGGIAGAVLAGLACGGNQETRTGTLSSALDGCLFESTDGNLEVNATGREDWSNAANLVTKQDKTLRSADNAFGQGTKEDLSEVTGVNGSIPPNKSDLTRFYIAHENLGGSFFLYLGWERSNVLGSANMDFEFNQLVQQQGFVDGSVGQYTVARSPGDILITFDFTNGGGNPVLGLLRWLTAASGDPASACFATSKLPCWGRRVDLSATHFAEGAVSSSLTFGEAAINLTAAAVFEEGQCINFASAFLKSRSSASFNAEIKDFIAPTTANITNCGQIRIHKVDDASPANPLAGARFQLFEGSPTGTICTGAAVSPEVSCTTDASGDCSMGADIFYGTYCVAEVSTPANHATAPAQSATLSEASSTLTLTFIDPLLHGAVKVTKTGKDKRCLAAGSPDAACVSLGVRRLAGAGFTLRNAGGAIVGTLTTGSDGTACLDKDNAVLPSSLLIGAALTVTETAAPTGFAID